MFVKIYSGLSKLSSAKLQQWPKARLAKMVALNMVSILLRYNIIYKALFHTEQYLNIDILHTICVGGILSRQYRQFKEICAFLVHMNQVTHFGTVSYLFASSGKWYACDGNCSNANWRLCTSLVWITSAAKRRSSGRFHCAPPALPPPAPSCLLLIWSIQRLKAYLVSPSLFNCNHFHLSSVTKPKSRLSSCIKTSDKLPLSTHNLWPKAAEGAGLRLRSWSFAVV